MFLCNNKKDSSIPKMEKTATGKSKVKMTDGLFAMMGRDQRALQNNGKAVDATSGQVKLLLDTEDVLPNIKNIATQEENGGLNYSGTTDLDWIHVNSFDFVDDDSLILSSREQNSLIKVSNIYEKPELDYIIHYGTLYKGSSYEDKLLTRKGNLVTPAGQHTVTVEKDNSLPDGQYYIYMFNNNYGRVTAFPEFDWSSYKDLSPSSNPKTGTSYYSKYLVDEKNGTYTLAQEFKLPYSSIVSSVQHLDGNIPYSSGRSKIFWEYDKDGNLIKSFRYDAQQFSYRVLKYNFKGFYFR